MNLSTGIGLQVLGLLKWQKEGIAVNEIISEINSIVPKVSASLW